MSEVVGVQIPQELPESGQVANSAPKMVAPILRVEELRDGDRSTCGSDTDGLSHGEASDIEGGEAAKNLGEFVPPDDELVDKIVQQVDFYFSDANILKDAFLLKHVRRNKLGYVSLKLITSFKKVKSLTKDYRVTAFALRRSENLEVNEEGTKVRRKSPLPDYDETTPSRTVVAVNLPIESPSIENVAELFAKCGEIALIRILKPGKTIPQDVKKHINKHPEIGTTVCAVVEFETHEAAQMACDNMTNKNDWRGGMRVVMLSIKKVKKEAVKDELEPKAVNEHGDGPSDEADEQDKKIEKKRKKTKNKRKNSRVEEIRDRESPCSSGSEQDCAETSPGRVSRGRPTLSPRQDINHLTPGSSARSTPNQSPRQSPKTSPNLRRRNTPGRSPLAAEASPSASPRHSPRVSPEMRRKRVDSEGSVGGSSPSSPWVQRRLKAQETSPLAARSPGTSPMLGRRNADGSMPEKAPPPRMANMEGVIRQPKGPDGSRGFGRGRGVMPHLVETAKERSETV